MAISWGPWTRTVAQTAAARTWTLTFQWKADLVQLPFPPVYVGPTFRGQELFAGQAWAEVSWLHNNGNESHYQVTCYINATPVPLDVILGGEVVVAGGGTGSLTVTLTYDDTLRLERRYGVGGYTYPLHSLDCMSEDRLVVPDGCVVTFAGNGDTKTLTFEAEQTWPARPFAIFTTLTADTDYTIVGLVPCIGTIARGGINADWQGVDGYYTYRTAPFAATTDVKITTAGGAVTHTFEAVADRGYVSNLCSGGYWPDFTQWAAALGLVGQAFPADTLNALVWGNFTRRAGMPGSLSLPDKSVTEIGGSGTFAEGEALPLYLDDLRALGTVSIGLIEYYDYVNSLFVALKQPWWTNPMQWRLDRQWAKENKHYLKEQDWEDLAATVDVPMLSITDCESDPWGTVAVTLEDGPVDKLTGARVSAWEGVDTVTVSGGGVGSSGSVTATIPAGAASPKIRRLLKSNLEAKVAWIVANSAVDGLPGVHQEFRSNLAEHEDWEAGGIPHGPWPEEDLWFWGQWAYALLKLDAPAVGQSYPCEVQMKVKYREITVVGDNHETGTSRAENFSLTFSSQKTATFTGEVSSAGSVNVLLCLLKAKEKWAPDLVLVDEVQIIFPASAVEQIWELDDLQLVADPGETGREEPATHLAMKVHEDFRTQHTTWPLHSAEKCGVISFNVDGTFQWAANGHDTYKKWEKEAGFPLINWLESLSETELDQPWGFRDLLERLTRIGNGITCSLSDANWDDYTLDSDDNRISNGYSFWLAAGTNVPVGEQTPVVGTYNFALRCASWQIAAGPIYKPRASLIVGGGAQGLGVQDGELARNVPIIPVYRGGVFHATVSTNEHAWYGAGFYEETENYDEDDESTFYTWQIDSQSLERLYRRQWIRQLIAIIGVGRVCHLHGEDGYLHVYYQSGGIIHFERYTTAGVLVDSGEVTEGPDDGYPYAWQSLGGRQQREELVYQWGDHVGFLPILNLDQQLWGDVEVALPNRRLAAALELPHRGEVLLLSLDADDVPYYHLVPRIGTSGVLDWAGALTGELTDPVFDDHPLSVGAYLDSLPQGYITLSWISDDSVHLARSWAGDAWEEI